MSSQHNEASPLAILGVVIAVVIAIVGVSTFVGRQSSPDATAVPDMPSPAAMAAAKKMEAQMNAKNKARDAAMAELDRLALKYEGQWRRVPPEIGAPIMAATSGNAPQIFPSRYETLRNARWEAKKKLLGRK